MDYRVLLIENSRIMLERLKNIIQGTKEFSLAASYRTPEEALGQGGVFKPNLILLDVEKEENIASIPAFRDAFPGVSLICLCNRWNAEYASRLVKAGAQGYLIKPFSGKELVTAVTTFGKSGMGIASKSIAFFSPKGKSGKTTLIANLAMSLAQKSGESVGIIDADSQFGDMAVFFNLNSKSTIVEAVRDIKFLSPITLNSYFQPVNDSVRVLCGTKRPEFAELIDTKGFTEMLKMAQSLFRYVLVDLPPAFNPLSIAACEATDETYMVAMVSGGFEIQHMQQAIEIFKDWADYQERLKVIFTRVEPCDSAAQAELEEELEYPVAAILPNEYLLVSTAANDGRMALDIKPDSALTHKINRLADKIIGRSHIRWDKP